MKTCKRRFFQINNQSTEYGVLNCCFNVIIYEIMLLNLKVFFEKLHAHAHTYTHTHQKQHGICFRIENVIIPFIKFN